MKARSINQVVRVDIRDGALSVKATDGVTLIVRNYDLDGSTDPQRIMRDEDGCEYTETAYGAPLI